MQYRTMRISVYSFIISAFLGLSLSLNWPVTKASLVGKQPIPPM